jgi:group I intron endonuclease
MKSGIYKITNETTGKFYIGSAKDIDWRWFEHKRDLRLKSHCNPKLQHSWDFYGEDKFTFVVLEEVEPDKQKLFEREQYYLDTFKPYIRGMGYNISPTASGGDNITYHPDRDAFIEKMSEISSGENNPMFGRTHRRDSVAKQREKAKGRFTLEWFIEKYGMEEGKIKYDTRRSMLSCNKVSTTKLRMKTIKPLLIDDIKSNGFSMKSLCEKYDVGMNVVKYYKRKLREVT